jgi:hypothetical protein
MIASSQRKEIISLLPLLATLDVLLGNLDDDARWCHLAATARDNFPTTSDRERSDCFLAGGVLGGKAEQFLSGVLEKVIRCPKRRWQLRIACATPKRH